MTVSEGHALALACVALVVLAGGLGLFGFRSAAALANALLALVFLAFALPEPVSYAWNPQAFIQRLGRAAISDLPLALVIAVMALIALACSGLLLAGRHAAFWSGWAANLPTAALLFYLAFWFRIF